MASEVVHPDPELQAIIDQVHAMPEERIVDLLGALLTDYAWSGNTSFGHAAGTVYAALNGSKAAPATEDETGLAVRIFSAADEQFMHAFETGRASWAL